MKNKKFHCRQKQNIWAYTSKILAWKAHVKAMETMHRFVALYSIFKCRTFNTKLETHLYKSLFRLILLYGAPAWGCAAANNMKNLQVIQNKIILGIYDEADHSGRAV
jgi:hypothetical protein